MDLHCGGRGTTVGIRAAATASVLSVHVVSHGGSTLWRHTGQSMWGWLSGEEVQVRYDSWRREGGGLDVILLEMICLANKS